MKVANFVNLSNLTHTHIVGFVVMVSIGLAGCSSNYCDDREIKESLADKIKSKIDFKNSIKSITFEDITNTSENTKRKTSQTSYCQVGAIKIKLGTGDMLTYNGKEEKLFPYQVSFYSDRKNNKKILESENTLLKNIDKARTDIESYYLGYGVVIDGVRKGGCPDGTHQQKDKNGDMIGELTCEKGLLQGIFKAYKNGFLAAESSFSNGLKNGTMKIYFPLTGKIKMTSELTNGKVNGPSILYDEKGYIKEVNYFENGILNKAYSDKRLSNLSEKESQEMGAKPLENFPSNNPNYLEAKNGVFVLGRYYPDSYFPAAKTEQELFERLDELNKKSTKEGIKNSNYYCAEVISIGNLKLFIQSGVVFYKNGEQVGRIGYNTEREGLCTTGQCQVMFKELIDKSIYKDEIYSILESAKPTK